MTRCTMKEIKGKLTLSFPHIDSIKGAYASLKMLSDKKGNVEASTPEIKS